MIAVVVALFVTGADAQVPGLPKTIDQWTTIVGLLLPLIIAAVNRTAWTSPLKAACALAICVVAAAGDLYFKGQFSAGAWAQNTVAVFFLVVTSYVGFWKPMGIADSIEKATG
jgi:hypothetical protein